MIICPSRKALITITILTLLASIIVVCTTGTAQRAYATPPVDTPQGTIEPSQEEIDALTAKINSEPIFQSKNNNGQLAVTPNAQQGYPTNTGQILITDDKFSGLIPTGHAAIVWDREAVIESLGNGVVWNANNWYTTHGNVWGVEVNGTSIAQDSIAAEWCSRQVGKPYNFDFFNTSRRDAFYCSQLVWAAYYDNFGIDISTPVWGAAIYPMEILDSPNVTKVYQK